MIRLRVAIETQFAIGPATGLGVYAAGLAAAVRRRGDVDVVELADPTFDLWRFDRRVYWDQVRAPVLARRARADVAHFTGGTLPARTRPPVVLTVHDLVWLRKANRGRFYVRWYYGALQPALARRADALIVDTEWARVDIADGLRVNASKIVVGGVGVDDKFFTLTRAPSDPPFALCVGTVEERKDLATAVRALARVPELRLVSVGPHTPYMNDVLQIARACGVADRVELRGYVSPAELYELYARASLLAFPSRYEGFGLPSLQALACGLPVAAARIQVTEEVLSDCAWYAPPNDADAFAQAYLDIMRGGDGVTAQVERGRARAASYSWATVAERIVKVYRALA